jgi:predicted outer membrane protein
VTPEENPTSQQFRQAGQQNRNALQGMSGAEFDRAYIANEVTYHQTVLDAIDNTLIPNAQNAELRALLLTRAACNTPMLTWLQVAVIWRAENLLHPAHQRNTCCIYPG